MTHISGLAMGFASTSISSVSVVKILFPNQEEVTKFVLPKSEDTDSKILATGTPQASLPNTVVQHIAKSTTDTKLSIPKQKIKQQGAIPRVATTSSKKDKDVAVVVSPLSTKENHKDKRIVTFLKSLF